MNPCRKIVVFSLFCLATIPFSPAKTVLAGPPVTMTVNTTADTVDATPGDGACADPSGNCSLRAAVMEANADPGSTILFSSALNGTPITLTRKGNDANAVNGDLDINASMTIQGNGPANTIVQGASDASYTNSIEDKIFGIDQDGTFPNLSVFISGMTIRYGDNNIPGNDPSWAQTGGGIDFWMTGSSGSSFTLSNCIVANNRNRNSYGGGMNIASDYYTSAKGTVQINNVTFQNNATLLETSGYYGASGGAINIESGWDLSVTISNSVFTGNSVTGVNNGGAINFKPSYTGSLAIHGCNFNNNSAGSRGGAVYIESLFNAYIRTVLIDQGTVFNGNISGTHATGTAEGGGVYITSNNAGDSMVLSQVTLTNNAEGAAAGVKAGGGAVAVGNAAGTVRVEYSRLVGNTAGSGSGLHKDNYDGTVTAVNNWWGCNAGPGGSGCDTAAIGGAGSGSPVLNYNPWITLKHSAAPATINTGETTTLTAGFLQNSAGSAIAATNLNALIGLPITFNNPVLGTISGEQTAIQSNGAATAAFTAGVIGGAGQADARVDNQTVTAGVTIIQLLPNLSINDVTQAEGNSGATTFTFTVSLSSPAGAGGVSFDIGTADGTAAAPSDFTAKGLTGQLIPAGSSAYTFDVLVNGDTMFEPNENFQVNINSVTGAVAVDGQGTGTIMNDDDPPEMNLKQGTTSIADGGTHNFSIQTVGSNTDVVFTIENTGTGPLILTVPLVIGGVNADQFSVRSQPVSPIAAGGSTTFTVRFASTTDGLKTATIAVANNDSDENPYELILTGTGFTPSTDPGSGGGGGGGGCFIGGASRGPRSGAAAEIFKSLKDRLLQVRQWRKSFAAWRQRIFP